MARLEQGVSSVCRDQNLQRDALPLALLWILLERHKPPGLGRGLRLSPQPGDFLQPLPLLDTMAFVGLGLGLSYWELLRNPRASHGPSPLSAQSRAPGLSSSVSGDGGPQLWFFTSWSFPHAGTVLSAFHRFSL